MNRTAARRAGRYGDDRLVHVNAWEEWLLKMLGGAGTVNPRTGLHEYYNDPDAEGTPGDPGASGVGPMGGVDPGGDGGGGMGPAAAAVGHGKSAFLPASQGGAYFGPLQGRDYSGAGPFAEHPGVAPGIQGRESARQALSLAAMAAPPAQPQPTLPSLSMALSGRGPSFTAALSGAPAEPTSIAPAPTMSAFDKALSGPLGFRGPMPAALNLEQLEALAEPGYVPADEQPAIDYASMAPTPPTGPVLDVSHTRGLLDAFLAAPGRSTAGKMANVAYGLGGQNAAGTVYAATPGFALMGRETPTEAFQAARQARANQAAIERGILAGNPFGSSPSSNMAFTATEPTPPSVVSNAPPDIPGGWPSGVAGFALGGMLPGPMKALPYVGQKIAEMEAANAPPGAEFVEVGYPDYSTGYQLAWEGQPYASVESYPRGSAGPFSR